MEGRKGVTVSKIRSEVHVSTARSGGPGGQHVNKVETKVILTFNIPNSALLSEEQKETINTKLSNKLTKQGDLIITANKQRSQVKNKEIAFKKLDRVLSHVFSERKKRKETKPTKAAMEKRIKDKKIQSEKKKMRQKW